MHLGAFYLANAPDRKRERRARDVPARIRLHANRTAAGPRINKLHVRACKKIDRGNQPCDATSQVNPSTRKHACKESFLNSKRKKYDIS